MFYVIFVATRIDIQEEEEKEKKRRKK